MFLARVFLVCFGLCFLFSCTLLASSPAYQTRELRLRVFSKEARFVSIKMRAYLLNKPQKLRVDVFNPVGMTSARVFLQSKQVLVYFPLKRAYYEDQFQSKDFFEQGPEVPATWIFRILDQKTPSSWFCDKTRNQKICRIKNSNFKVRVTKKKDWVSFDLSKKKKKIFQLSVRKTQWRGGISDPFSFKKLKDIKRLNHKELQNVGF